MFDKCVHKNVWKNKQTNKQRDKNFPVVFLVFFFFFFYRRVTHKRHELWNNRADLSAPLSDDNSNSERL